MAQKFVMLICAFLVVSCQSLAVPVNHDDSEGIAAITRHIDTNIGNILAAAVALGTDGNLYLISNNGNLIEYKYPYDIEIDWPVEFKQITDWTPLFLGLPDSDEYFINPGVIRCEDGSRWISRLKQSGGWDMAGQTEYEHEWIRIQGLK